MAILANQTLVGNVGKIYELRTVGKNNSQVLDFSVAVTPRKKDGDDWVDDETYWVNCTAWNKLAENISNSFKSGDRVIIIGHTQMKEGYTNKDGVEVGPKQYLVVDFAGLEVSYNGATSERKSGGGGGGSYSSKPKAGPAPKKEAPKADEIDNDLFADDDGFDFGGDDEPPF